MRSRALLVSAVLAAGAVGLALAASRGAAAAGGSALTVQAAFGTETWYQRDPACGTPAGCSPVTPPAQNPYGAGTLHVAVTAGSEVARSYLAVAPVTASGGAALTGAVLTVPLDTATAGNGSLAPETATVGVCTSSAALTAPEGSYDPPPGTSCAGEATLTYTATPAPALVADLSSLLPTLARQLPAGIDLALLPLDPAATASWHAVASSDARATLPVPPPSLALTYTAPGSVAPVQAAPSSAPAGGTSPTPVALAGGGEPTPGSSPRAAPPPSARPGSPAASARASTPVTARATAPAGTPTATSRPVPAAPPAVPPAVPVVPAVLPMVAVSLPSVPPATPGVSVSTVTAPPTPAFAAQPPAPVAVDPPVAAAAAPFAGSALAGRTVTTGFAYPVVLLLPLLLVGGGVLLARIMTRDLTPPARRFRG